MRHMRIVFCSLAVLVMVGIGSAVDSADTLPDATTDAWGETRKLCLQNEGSSSQCNAITNQIAAVLFEMPD